MELERVTTQEFNGHKLDCYVEPSQTDRGTFWATREQIGQLLGYAFPRKAIKKIHERNKERLNLFSRVVKLSSSARGAQNDSPSGGSQNTTVYNFRGLLEICRYSNQPIANAVIDKLWDIADEIRRTGMYLTDQVAETQINAPAVFEALTKKYVEERKANRELRERIASDRAFTNLGRVVLALPGAITFQSAAQFLCEHGIPTGQNRLYRKCREKKLLCSRKGKQHNRPTQSSIEQGLFSVELSGGFNAVTLVTPKGLSHLLEMLSREEYPLIVMMEEFEDD